jgi:ADP-heptose:LPS heptosyltransferase
VWPGGDPAIFEIGLWDDLKRQNRRSYLEMLAAAAGVTYSGGPPALLLSDEEQREAAAEVNGLRRPIVAFNTDAGTRWTRKQWNLEYVREAAHMLAAQGCSIALFGGSRVAEFNDALAAERPEAFRSYQSARDVRRFFALIRQMSALVTGDTLAMHAAWALGIPVIALFGPTSLHEIDLHPDDIKLADTTLPCLGCYQHTCAVNPHCMDRLTPPEIVRAVIKRLSMVSECAPSA